MARAKDLWVVFDSSAVVQFEQQSIFQARAMTRAKARETARAKAHAMARAMARAKARKGACKARAKETARAAFWPKVHGGFLAQSAWRVFGPKCMAGCRAFEPC